MLPTEASVCGCLSRKVNCIKDGKYWFLANDDTEEMKVVKRKGYDKRLHTF